MTAPITEAEMTIAFEGIMRARCRLPGLPKLASFTKEVACLEGRPDFVASPTHALLDQDFTAALQSALATPSVASVLSLLKLRAPRTEAYLLRATGLSRAVTHRALAMLVELQLVEESRAARYVRTSRLLPETELWAFELKTDNWQRALYQAHRDLAFCHRSVVVMAENGARRASQQLDRFRALGVGLLALDAQSEEVLCVLPPRAARPSSQWHYLHALGKFMSAYPVHID